MTYISEEEESLIDRGKTLNLQRGDAEFTIESYDIYCYGEVNFDLSSDDMYKIDNLNFLDYLKGASGYPICSDYDYESHTCKSPISCYRITETWHPSVLARYAHGCLGKPQRIVLFKHL